MQALLRVNDLELIKRGIDSDKQLIKRVSFNILLKQTLVLLGETGSGKSLTALSILGLLPPEIYVGKTSEIWLEGENITESSENEMQRIRGGKIAIIFQDASSAFNPILTIEQQISEVLKLHRNLPQKMCQNEVYRLLEMVEINEVKRVAKAYPHQLSGGMKQRAMIAMALAGKPKLLIADEATSALDLINQKQLLKLLKKLQTELEMGVLFITHDLRVAAQIADEVAVLHQGELVEQGGVSELLTKALHPYTRKLIHSVPNLEITPILPEAETLLEVKNLTISFPLNHGILQKKDKLIAVDDVSFRLKGGETLAIVGGSGCGKTTLVKGVLSLLSPVEGKVVVLGDELFSLSTRRLREKREDLQIIFQDPLSAMDPRFQIKDILMEGMLALGIGSDRLEREDRIHHLLQQVGLVPEHLSRYPHQLSGGQRQRVCIARALAVGPRILVCDEPTSSLDKSVEAEIIDLLIECQNELEISYLLITHDLALVHAMAHRVLVMQDGKVVESGPVAEVLAQPKHPYTRLLLESAFADL